jgi:hypothetical protein
VTCVNGFGAPIFIIGTERSGSNLLRLVLDAHPRIAVPHPPHFMRYLAPHADRYGDLTVTRNRRRLVDDALTLLRRHIHPWNHPIDGERVLAESAPTVFGVVAAIYEQYREGAGKARWGCKSTFMVDHVDEALAGYPSARFVWLVRDPRDVASSARRSVFGPCHPLLTARLWTAQQERARAARARLGAEVVALFRYEDLVADPRAEITRLCGFLGEEPAPAMFEPHRTEAARQTSVLSRSWANTGRPISGAAVRRYERDLSPRDRADVEHTTWPLLVELGYETDPARRPEPPRPFPAGVKLRNAALRAAVEMRSMRSDANHWRRWRRDVTAYLLRLGARRGRRLPSG